MGKKRKPLKWWAVPLLTMVALVAVAGVTALVMYIAGAFTEEQIDPADISFSAEVEDGLARFDSSDSTYYTSSDFSMVITTSTEDATATSVTLSLNGGTITSDGCVTNGIITVPQNVSIGSAFTVSLVTDSDGNIVGGISRITAVSENPLASRQSVYVAVDVPASSFSLEVVDTVADSDGVFEVIEGTTFSVDEVFSPTNAKYLYSDSSVTKEVFYAYSGSEYITMTDSESGTFTADTKTTTILPTITAYTFTSAYYQEEFFSRYSEISDRDELARLIENEYDTNANIIASTISVKVVEVTVESLEITDELLLSITADKTFTITVNSTSGDGSLGAVITDTMGVSRSSLASNIGILVTGYLGNDKFTEYSLSGGYIMRIDPNNGTISQVTSVSNDGATYYYLPNTNISPKTAYGNYYWTFATTSSLSLSDLESLEVSLYVNYFYQDDNGTWTALYSTDTSAEEMKTVSVEIVATTETPASWTDTTQLNLEISYDSDSGSEIAASINLSTLLSSSKSFSANTYQTIKYFFVVSGTSGDDVDEIKEVFNVESAEYYAADYLNSGLGYYLLEISDTTLIASTISSSTFKIVAVTVRTDANGSIVAGDNTKYQIVTISEEKEVIITSALSIANMTGYIALDNSTAKYSTVSDSNGSYYIPYVFYDTNGLQVNQITFVLNLEQKSTSDKTKFENALTGDISLKVLDVLSGEAITTLSTSSSSWTTVLSSDAEDSKNQPSYATTLPNATVDNNSTVFYQTTITVTIDEDTFANAQNRSTAGISYKFQLVFGDETKDVCVFNYDSGFVKSETDLATNATNVDVSNGVSYLRVYYPEPAKITSGYDDKGSGTITVENKANSGTSITWNGAVTSITLSNFNELLIFDIVDQFGNYILSEGVGNSGTPVGASNLFDVKFVETTTGSSVVGLKSSGKQISNFASTSAATTTLVLYVTDKNTTSDYVLDDALANAYCSTARGTFTLDFSITSDGLSKVEYDSSTSSSTTSTDDFVESSNMGSITVSKYVQNEITLTLDNLFKLYVNESETSYSSYTIEFASTYNSSTTSLSDLSEMFYFNGSASNTLAKYVSGDFSDALETITFNSAFGKDTTLYFVIKDKTNLFEVEFNLVCLTGGSVGVNFDAYGDTAVGSLTYADFLAESGTTGVASVFADNEYKISTYLPLTNQGTLALLWGTNSTITETSQPNILTLIEYAGDLYLKIGSVTTATLVTFTIYLNGIESSFNISATVTIYVVPNVLIVENSAYYTLGGENSIPFTFYKATEYLSYLTASKNGESASLPTAIYASTLNETYKLTYTPVESYLTITYSESDSAYVYTLASTSIEIELGASVVQTFTVSVDAVRICSDGTVVTFDETDGTTLTIEIGLGTATKTIQSVFGTEVEIVEYNNGTYILLASGGEVTVVSDSGFSLSGNSGAVTVDGTTLRGNTGLLQTSTGTVSVSGGFESFLVTFNIDVLVSATGTDFVLYYETESGASTNTYGDVSFSNLTALNMSESDAIDVLEENDVYQKVDAGASYTLVHVLNETHTSTTTWGLYYSSGTVNITCISATAVLDESTVNLTISDLLSIEEDSYNTGCYKLTINNLSTDYTCVYAVFKLVLTLTSNGSTGTTTYYYRIQITPNFDSGSVTYPYASDAEYIDTNSECYSSGTYEIDLNEVFGETNSNSDSGKTRFTAPTAPTAPTDATATYAISSVSITEDSTTTTITTSTGTYFTTIEVSGTTLTITPNSTYASATFKIVLVATYTIDNLSCYGGELYYTIIINGGNSYTFSLTADSANSDTATLSGTTYSLEISASTEEQKWTVSVSKAVGNTGSTPESVTYSVDNTTCGDVSFDGTTLSITAPESVTEDTIVTVRFYTDQQVVFRVVITFVSYYVYEINSDFSGGITYGIYSENESTNAILQNVSSTESTVTGVSISLKNDTTTQFGKEVSLSSLVKIDTDTIEFAHLLQDTDFTFVGTITDGTNAYSFTFTITVKASFSTSTSRTFVANSLSSIETYTDSEGNECSLDDGTTSGLYGGLTYAYCTYDSSATNTTTNSIIMALGLDTSGSMIYSFSETSSTETSATIDLSLTYVDTETTTSETVTVYAWFNGTCLFSFDVKVTYTILPSVSIQANYPVTKGTTTAEYIQVTEDADGSYVSEEISSFFVSTATLATAERISGTYVYNSEAVTLSGMEASSISITSISNASVVAKSDSSSTTYTTTANFASTYLTLSSLSLKFTLTNATYTGTVTFNITINGITMEYIVILTTSDLVTLKANSPTTYSTTTGETIYAEDLASQISDGGDAYVFAQDRLLMFRTSSVTSFTVKFFDGTSSYESRDVTCTAGVTTYFDLGKSFTDWTIYSITISGTEHSDWSSYFTIQPSLTARVVAVYADGNQISIEDSDLTYGIGTSGGTKLSSFKVSSLGTQDLSISYETPDGTTEEISYIITLSLDIQVEENMNGYTQGSTLVYYEMTAGDSISLLGSSNSLAYDIGITTKSDSTTYTEDILESNNATISLELYGFSTLQVGAGNGYDEYQEAAYEVHEEITSANYLTNQDGVDVVYSTGITPRYGMTLNTDSGDQSSNYIVFSGLTIEANGASNDGNFVMIRLTYSVDLDHTTVEAVFNILVKVYPNVTVSHKTSASDSSTAFDTNQLYDGSTSTVASNKGSEYEIKVSELSDETYSFNLFGDAKSSYTSGTVTYSDGNVITSNTTFTATMEEFTYGGVTYNEYGGAVGQNTTSGNYEMTTGKNVTDTSSLSGDSFTAVKINGFPSFGQKYFMITLTDAFGYVVHFYFTVVAEIDPGLSVSYVTEGEKLYFWATTTEVVATTTTVNETEYYVFNNFTLDSSTGFIYLVYNTTSTANTVSTSIILSTTASTDYYNEAGEKLSTTNKTIKASTTSISSGTDLTSLNWTYDDEDLYVYDAGSSGYVLLTLSSATVSMLVNTSADTFSAYISTKETVDTSADEENVDYKKIPMTYSTGDRAGIGSDFGTDGTTVEVTGLNAYGFSSGSTLDTNAIVDAGYTTIAQSLYVSSVEFYYDGILLGSAADSVASDGISLNETYQYVDANGTPTSGNIYTPSLEVPNIDGIYYDLYGSGNELEVTMVVTIVYGSESAKIEKSVILTHSSFENVFKTETIADGQCPVVSNDWTTSTQYLLNDTLEIDLEAGETVTLAVSLSDIEFSVTTDTAPSSSKTYYTYADEKYSVTNVTSFDSTTTYYELNRSLKTFTNNKSYAVTQYVSISELILDELTARTGNLTISDHIYYLAIATDSNGNEKMPTITYNGDSLFDEDYKVGQYYSGDWDVDKYVGLQSDGYLIIEIPSAAELDSISDVMYQTLYFVAVANGTSYQLSQVFEVQPTYTSATMSSGSVASYYLVDDSYYVVPFTSWTENITVTGASASSANEKIEETLSSLDAKKFTFEIASGSAYIDENGTITTKSKYQGQSNVIKVNIYMKTSGIDGNFEEENTALSLGTFSIWLSESATPNTDDNLATGGAGTYIYYNSTNSNGYTIMTCSSSIYACGDLTEYTGNYETGIGYDTSLSVELGGEIDFSEVLSSDDDADWASWTNVAYHITSEDGSAVSSVELSTHTFSTLGVHEIGVLVAGYKSGVYCAELLTVTVVVYSTSTITTTTVSVAVEKSSATYSLSNTGITGTWYEVDEESGTAESDVKSVVFSSTGLITKTYLVIDDSTYTSVTLYTFVTLNLFVFDSSETQTCDVVIAENGSFKLSGLSSDAEAFYSSEDLDTAISTDKIATSCTKTYYAVTSDSVICYQVTFTAMTSTSSTATYGAYVQSTEIEVYEIVSVTAWESGETYYTYADGTYTAVDTSAVTEPVSGTTYYIKTTGTGLTAENIKSAILTALDASSVDVYVYSSNGILSEVSDIQTDDAIVSNGHTYFVKITAEDGTTTYQIITMNFFIYSAEETLTATVIDSDISTEYPLSNLNSRIDSDSSVTYWTISGSSLVVTSSVNLDVDVTFKDGVVLTKEKYFVRVENSSGKITCYLYTITFEYSVSTGS